MQADSGETYVVEGDHYSPPESLNWEYFSKGDHHTTCFRKWVADYYDIEADGESYKNCDWSYPVPSKAAERIKDYVAFYPRVKVAD